MLRGTLVGLAALVALALSFRQAQAQSHFKSGYYEITSGEFTECCGFAGNPFSYVLPDERQAFVELILDPGGNTARMAFLMPDLRTAFNSYPWITDRSFAFSFDNGVVHSNYIQFGDGAPVPRPTVADWNYTVRDNSGSLGISGVTVTPMFGADVPNQFEHINVVATLLPNPVVIDRIERDNDSMRFHFTGRPLYDYFVEYSDSLTTPNWQAHSSHRAKVEPVDVVVTNSLKAAQTRYFRIRTEPCNCR